MYYRINYYQFRVLCEGLGPQWDYARGGAYWPSQEAIDLYWVWMNKYEYDYHKPVLIENRASLLAPLGELSPEEIRTESPECPSDIEGAVDWLKKRTDVFGVTKDGRIAFRAY